MAESKKTMRILLLIGAVVLVGRGFWWFFVGGAPNEPEPRISNAIPRSASQRPTSLDKPTPPSRQVRRPVGAVGAPQLRDPELQEGKDTGGDPIVYGSDSSGILTALQSIRPDIKRCFDKSIREDGITGGRVSFEFRIEAQPDHPKNADVAMISGVQVEDTTIDSEMLEECVMQRIDGLWFEPPEDGPMDVVMPFVFVDEVDD